MNNKTTYSSFNSIPWKLVKSYNIFPRRIEPLHIRIMPTNRCNANCKWCCYADADKRAELSTEEIKEIILYFFALGTRAITFSGGGEPTLHPGIEDMLTIAKDKGISCGLVTNGIEICHKKT